MILSDSAIKKCIASGDIVIDPFDPERLGPNSYDVTLGRNLLYFPGPPIRADAAPEMNKTQIPKIGLLLEPGTLYLGVINEFIATGPNLVPMIDGTSSAGRLGISIHATAGRGDAGYAGHFTLEISVVEPVSVFPNMPIGQIWWLRVEGEVEQPYGKRGSSNYYTPVREEDPIPKPSAMWKKLARRAL